MTDGMTVALALIGAFAPSLTGVAAIVAVLRQGRKTRAHVDREAANTRDAIAPVDAVPELGQRKRRGTIADRTHGGKRLGGDRRGTDREIDKRTAGWEP
ncbi:MAG: hypothetical protein ABJF01_17520 [bacterium]